MTNRPGRIVEVTDAHAAALAAEVRHARRMRALSYCLFVASVLALALLAFALVSWSNP